MAAAAQRPEGPGVSNRGGSSRESGVTGIADRADARSGHAAVHESGINRKADGAGDWGQSAALLHEERVMSTPFDTAGVTRGPDGIKRYDGLPSSLVHMLRDTVEGHPDREALAETGGGPRLTYQSCGTGPHGWPVGSGRPACSAGTGWRYGSATASTGSSASSERCWRARQ